MSLKFIDGHLLKKMIICAANELSLQKHIVDNLNVFPVPDGDTGTNMSLTALAAAREVSLVDTDNVYTVAKAAASGSLRGARGNSGVILSQLFRGFAKGLEGKSKASPEDIKNACVKSTEMGYKSVMKPREGTMLTISKAISEKAVDCSYYLDDLEEIFAEVFNHTSQVLQRTQDMLPQLKKAGVVDAGGMGLLTMLEGAIKAISIQGEVSVNEVVAQKAQDIPSANFDSISSEEIKFAYCTEFFIDLKDEKSFSEVDMQKYLDSIGDSIVLVVDEPVVKIHVHTNHPGQVLEKALVYGPLSNLKIENMKLQHSALTFGEGASTPSEDVINFFDGHKEEEGFFNKEVGFIVISDGVGMREAFKSLGANVVIEGATPMLPEKESISSALEKMEENIVILLPNSMNMDEDYFGDIISKSKKEIHILPTKSLPEGLAALISFLPTAQLEHNLEKMTESINHVNSGQLFSKDGVLTCLLNHKAIDLGNDADSALKLIIKEMLSEDSEIISIYYGKNISEARANEIYEQVLQEHDGLEVELHNGGLIGTDYVVSVE